MQWVSMRVWISASVFVVLAACTGAKEPELLNLRASQSGPDEFAILPTKPLETPADYATLPPPTPGGINRVDPTPQADAYIALAGNPAAARGGLTDAGLINHVSRFGIAPDIRRDLAAADLEYRRVNDGRLLERLFNVNVYFRAYRPFELDQYRELERFRAAGIRTPAAPPQIPAE